MIEDRSSLTSKQDSGENEGEGKCPVCFNVFKLSDLNAHCNTHFGAPQDVQDLTSNPRNNKGQDGIHCPFGCDQIVPQGEMESHEAAHRCTAASLMP